MTGYTAVAAEGRRVSQPPPLENDPRVRPVTRNIGFMLLIVAVCAAAVWETVSEAVALGGPAALLRVAVGSGIGAAFIAVVIRIDPHAEEGQRGSGLLYALMFPLIFSVPFWDRLSAPLHLTFYAFMTGVILAFTIAMSWRMAQHYSRRASGAP